MPLTSIVTALFFRRLSALVLGVGVLGGLGLGLAGTDSQARLAPADTTRLYAIVLVHNLPPEARVTLTQIKAGGPFSYRQDGSVFGNREGFLPARYRGYYTEYTVPTPGARDRGARRIVAGAGIERSPRRSGEYYYTDDHYQSFRKIIER